jgi:hypothetical protein
MLDRVQRAVRQDAIRRERDYADQGGKDGQGKGSGHPRRLKQWSPFLCVVRQPRLELRPETSERDGLHRGQVIKNLIEPVDLPEALSALGTRLQVRRDVGTL